jgi:hypothetical protein
VQAYLKKHGPSFSNHSLKVIWQRTKEKIVIEFFVQKRTGPGWQTDPVFTQDWLKNWGLWNKDVVEAFLQLRSHDSDISAPYLEIQVSPLNQPFTLIITEPRKTYFPPKELIFSTEVNLTEKLWSAKMELTLPGELQGHLLYGGFFSCLSVDPREFYALEPNPESGPDFHRPELFLRLDE